MTDLSQYSTADLQALRAGNMAGVSTPALQMLRAQQAPEQQEEAAAPQVPGVMTQLGHAALDIPGGIAHGIGTLADVASNAYHGLRGEPTVSPGAPESLATSFSSKFSHEPDYEEPDIKQQLIASGNVNAKLPEGPFKQTLEEYGPQALEATSTAAGVAGGIEGIAAKRAATVTARQAAVDNTAVAQARQWGFKATPHSVRQQVAGAEVNVPGEAREQFTGPRSARIEVQRHNAANATAVAARDGGLPNAQAIHPDDIEIARGIREDGSIDPDSPLGTYQRATNAVGENAPVHPELDQRLRAVGAGMNVEPATETAINAQIARFRSRYASHTSGPQLMSDISDLRMRATRGMKSEDPRTYDMGLANRQIADSLEEEVIRQLPPDSQLSTEFPQARTRLAKLHDIEITTRGGQMDPQALFRLQSKGVPLTGGLKAIADYAGQAPDVMVHPRLWLKSNENFDLPHTAIGFIRKGIGALARKFPGMDVTSEGFQTRNFGPRGVPPAPAPSLALQRPGGQVSPPPPAQLGMRLPEGPQPAPQLNLEMPQGPPREPQQLGMPMNPGAPMEEVAARARIFNQLRQRYGIEPPMSRRTGEFQQ